MRYSRRGSTLLIPLAFIPLTLATTGIVVGPSTMSSATLWMFIEATLALVIAIVLGLAATLVAGPRTLPYLDQIVSRGLELTAALPMVLACGVLAVIVRIPIPIAIAVVIGVLGGLRCVRVVVSAAPTTSSTVVHLPLRAALHQSIMLSLIPVVPTVVEQIVGLEAAIAWLGLFDQGWTGGWGERLGQAARHGALAHLAAWTLPAVGLSVGLKVLVWRIPEPLPDTSDGGNAS